MKLIDILVMISKGELKEGAKIKKYYKNEYDFTLVFVGGLLKYNKCRSIYTFTCEELNEKCELIEPDHFTDVGKMATEKIEELDKENYYDVSHNVETIDIEYAFLDIFDKLNEVINKVNAQTTVLLAQEKEIKEIKEQLDY